MSFDQRVKNLRKWSALCQAALCCFGLSHHKLLWSFTYKTTELENAISLARAEMTCRRMQAISIVSVCVPSSRAWEEICSLSRAHFLQYSLQHDYGLAFFETWLASQRPIQWSKIPAMLHILQCKGVHFGIWIDADSLMKSRDASILPLLPPSDKFGSISFDGGPNTECGTSCINTGHFSLRSSQMSLQYLNAAWNIYPQPSSGNWPFYEQASLQYVLLGQRWRDHCRKCIFRCPSNPKDNASEFDSEGRVDSCCDLKAKSLSKFGLGMDFRSWAEMNSWLTHVNDHIVSAGHYFHTFPGQDSTSKRWLMRELSTSMNLSTNGLLCELSGRLCRTKREDNISFFVCEQNRAEPFPALLVPQL